MHESSPTEPIETFLARRARRVVRGAALACGLAVLAGCSSGTLAPAGAPVIYPAVVAPRAVRFQNAVSSFDEQVQLLEAAPASLDAASLGRALGALADALENMPDAQGVDVAGAAADIRQLVPGNAAAPGQAATTEPLRTALQSAAGALLLLAEGPYRTVAGLAERVRSLRLSVDAIDPLAPAEVERRQVLEALARTARTLLDFERAAGMVPTPAVRAPGGVAAGAGGVSPRPAQAAAGVLEVQRTASAASERGPLEAAMTSYSTWVDRFASQPPDASTLPLVHAIDALADAIDALPRGAGLAPGENATALRRHAQDLELASPLSAQQARVARDAFARTWTFLAVAADRAYRDAPAVKDQVDALHEQYVTVDPSRPLAAQRLQVLGSLEAAESVLRTIALVVAR